MPPTAGVLPKSITCAGCLKIITVRQYLRCYLCKQHFDLICANVSEKRFLNTMSKEHKTAWKCEQCKAKQPKCGNMNTPVRGLTNPDDEANLDVQQPTTSGAANTDMLTCTHSDTENVTIRRGGSQLICDNSVEGSLNYTLEDTYCLENIRVIVREELRRVVDDRLTDVICKAVVDQIGSSMNVKIAELNKRISTLEASIKELQKTQTEMKQMETNQRTVSYLPLNPQAQSNQIGLSAPNNTSNMEPSAGSTQDTLSNDASFVPSINVTSNEERSKHSRNSSMITRGTAAPGSTQIQASERWKYLHLYYVRVGTTVEQVLDHLKSIHDGLYTVESLKARGNYASFKLGVPAKLVDQIMSPQNWTEDICIKPWKHNFRPRTRKSQTE